METPSELLNIGLSPQEISLMQSVFTSFDEVEQVVLYGSRAKGNYKEASDIDLTMFGDKLTLTLQQQIELALDDLLLPYKVDLSVFVFISNPDLKDHIHRVGKVFYLRKLERFF